MTRQLPFEIQPTVQHHDIGGTDGQGLLRFRKIGGVAIAERDPVVEVDQTGAIFIETSKLCERIKAEARIEIAGIGLGQLYLAVDAVLLELRRTGRAGGQPQMIELAVVYAEPLLAIAELQDKNAEAVLLRKATTMIRTRLRGCQDWTDDDTRQLEPDALTLEIASFYDREVGSLTGADKLGTIQEQLAQLEADMGKLLQEPGSRSPTPTGESSTGSADSITPEPPSSTPTASDSSTSPTSSRRSKRPARPSGSASTTRK